MGVYDTPSNQFGTVDPKAFNQLLAAPVEPYKQPVEPHDPESRSPIGEIWSQLKAGAFSDLPRMAGRAMQYASNPGNELHETGKRLVEDANAIATLPEMQPSDTTNRPIVGALSKGARMIPQSIAPAVGAGLVLSGVGAPAGVALLGGSALAAAPAGMAQAQETFEKGLAKHGLTPEQAAATPDDPRVQEATTAARMTGGVEWGGEMAASALAGRFMGIGGGMAKSAIGRMLNQGERTAAQTTLKAFTTPRTVGRFAGNALETVAGETATEMAQGAGGAAIEQRYGYDTQTPWDAATESIAPTLGMSALLLPFGIPAHASHATKINAITSAMQNPETAPELRSQAAEIIYNELAKQSPGAAANFAAHSFDAIHGDQDSGSAPYGLNLDENVLDPLTPRALQTEAKPAGPLSYALSKKPQTLAANEPQPVLSSESTGHVNKIVTATPQQLAAPVYPIQQDNTLVQPPESSILEPPAQGGNFYESTDAGRIGSLQDRQEGPGGSTAGFDGNSLEHPLFHDQEKLIRTIESTPIIGERFKHPAIRKTFSAHYHNPSFWTAMAERQPELAKNFNAVASILDSKPEALPLGAKIAANFAADAIRLNTDPIFEQQSSNLNSPAVQELAVKWYQERGEQSPFFRLWSRNSPVVSIDSALPASSVATGTPITVKGWHTSPDTVNRYHKEYSGAHSGFESKGWIWTAPQEEAQVHSDSVSGMHGDNYTTEQFYQRMKNPKVIHMIGKGITRAAMEKAQEKGHDGVLLTAGGKVVNAVVFEANNFKSVGNRGTFNPSEYSRYSVQKSSPASATITDEFNTQTTPNIPLQAVEAAFPGQIITQEAEGYTITMKNGATAKITTTGEISFDVAAAEAAYGRKMQPGEKPVASFQALDRQAVITLTAQGAGEIHHETFHAAMALALDDKQRTWILNKYGTEEAAAAAYQRLRDNGSFETRKDNVPLYFRILYSFFSKIRALFDQTHGIMANVASGKVWENPAVHPQQDPSVTLQPRQTLETLIPEETLESEQQGAASENPKYSIKDTLGRLISGRNRSNFNDTIQQPRGIDNQASSAVPEIEKRWQAAHGLSGGPTLKERMKSFMHDLLSETNHYPNLDTSNFSGKRTADILRRFESSDVAAKAKTVEYLHSLTTGFGPKKMDLFTRKVVLDDLMKEASKGRALSFGYTPETVKTDHLRISKLVESNPDISAAIERRTEVNKTLVMELVDNDLLPVESVLTPEGLDRYKKTGKYGPDDINTGYFRHQVLEHANARKWAGISTVGEVRNKRRGWQKQREGSTLDINTNFLEAEFEVYSQSMKELATKKALDEVLSLNDVTVELKDQAKLDNIEDWNSLIPEGYTAWQPERGSVFYRGQSLPESIITRFADENPAFKNMMDKFRAVTIMGGKKETVIIPEGLAKTLDNLRTNREDATLDTINKKLVGGWKIWTLLSPRRALKYNLNNMSGDLDIAFAADPGILKHFKTAWENALERRANRNMTQDERDMLDRAVIDAGISVNEIPDISQLPGFQHLKEPLRNVKLLETLQSGDLSKLMPANLVARYFDTVSGLTQLREGLLREAAYLRAKELLEKGKTIYWASKPDEIDALPDIKDKAAKLSRELIGDYGNISAHGEKIRTSLIPFWSWMEINTPRYYRLFKNAATQKESGSFAARMAGVGARKTAGTALNLAEKVALTHLLFAAVNTFNHLMHPDEEKKLSAASRGQLHLILGTTSDGKILTVRFSGAFSDALSWFGLEDYAESFKKLSVGQMDAQDMLKKMTLATPNKLANSASPFTKLAGELIAGKSIYPDISKPMPIRDKSEQIARFFALDEEYKALAGKPSKGYLDSLKNLLVYESDPGEIAYHSTRQQIYRFLEKRGIESPAAEPTERSKSLYYFKQALRYQDKEAIAKYKAAYLEAGGKREGLHKSIKRAHPMGGLPLRLQGQFVQQLSPRDRENLKHAIEWYKEVYFSKPTPSRSYLSR